MHWLLVLALLSSTTNLKEGTTGSALNRAAESALRQRLGNANIVRVDVARGSKWAVGDFDHFNVTLDGFNADGLLQLDARTTSTPAARPDENSYPDENIYPGANRYPGEHEYPGDEFDRRLNNFDLGDIVNDDIFGRLGGIFGDILGKNSNGRIGRMQLNATNFTFQGVRYNGLSASLGEINFDWGKALRGEFDVKSVQPGSLQLRLSADQAARFIAPRLPSLKDVRLRFAGGKAFVGGKADFYGVRVPIEVGGRLSVQANQVRADDIHLSLARLRLPPAVVAEITKGVNPLYDFDPQRRWPIAVNLNTADARDNTLAMQGGIQWIGFNRNRDSR
ncbi:MAG TPA: LmeA family phospholipid-binding protein [Abditibacteriaceae bacterium]|nr:LmeA family phospholipid-binding protein [Abditibacteriaceae bacterium]